MTTTLETLLNPRFTISKAASGMTEVHFAMNGWGADIVCKYWPEPDATERGRDPWTYELETIEGKGGRYSHVSEKGCQIAIARHLIDAGLIGPSEDNSHLDTRNQKIARDIKGARDGQSGGPKVGDYVLMPSGQFERCASGSNFGMQTTAGGSFFVFSNGNAQMSGGLNRAQLWDYYQPTDETKLGRFWFFSHNEAGAGRGVDVFLPCQVWRLEPFTMTEDEARSHAKAKAYAKTWGENAHDHLRVVQDLMEGRA